MSGYSVKNTIFWQCMSGQAVVQGGGRCKDFWSQSDSRALKLGESRSGLTSAPGPKSLDANGDFGGSCFCGTGAVLAAS